MANTTIFNVDTVCYKWNCSLPYSKHCSNILLSELRNICHLNLLVTDKLKVTFTYLTKTSTFHFSNYRSKKFWELPLLLGKSKIQRSPMDLWFPISNDVKVRLFLVLSVFFARATQYPLDRKSVV